MEYPCDDVLLGENKYWNGWHILDDGAYAHLTMDEFGKAAGASSNFYQRKGLDYNINASKVYEAQVDWVEIRFTEVLMNYGECANEVGKSGEALQVLYDVRKRSLGFVQPYPLSKEADGYSSDPDNDPDQRTGSP